MDLHRVLPIAEASQVGDARRTAVRLAEETGFDENDTARVALLTTELATNLVRHAQQGRLLLATLGPADRRYIELISVDDGPGMAALDACMQDGFSTGGSPGTGLGAVRRIADRFEAFSSTPEGSVLLAQLCRPQDRPFLLGAASAGFTIGALAVAAPGESVSGDAWCSVVDAQRLSLAVADGLGHGPMAAEAANAVCAAFTTDPFGAPAVNLERAHGAARGTRGAAAAFALLDAGSRLITFSGAGNIVGRLLSGIEERTFLSQHGTVGLQIRRPEPVTYPWPDHALVVMHSDGLAARWTLRDTAPLLRSHPALIAAWLYARHARGRDDATVVVIRHE